VGGLVSALDPVVRDRGGLWIASTEPGKKSAVPPRSTTGYEVSAVPLSEQEVEGHYRRVATGVLWPLLHSFPSRMRTKDAPWDVYRSVNTRFARRAAVVGPDATYWIHDFQLALVPGALRALRPGARIGWFNHVPWPAPEIFALLPERTEFLEGLLGADLLGFQTSHDARNFLASVQELTHYDVDASAGVIRVGGREVNVQAFPIGIDVDSIQQISADPDVAVRRRRLRSQLGSAAVLLAVDRLDYTKGVPERLQAFAELLDRRPEFAQRVTLVQVAVPSRTGVDQYDALKREVDELVGQINGRYGSPTWTPIHYLYRGLDLRDLVTLYGMADVAVVTPLRDGMNLVAQEFVASRLDYGGVLMLSEFAGAATILDGAMLVNPYDLPRTADALAQAVLLPAKDQEDRMRRLAASVRRHRIGLWYNAFLSTLEGRALDPTASSVAPAANQSGCYPRVG